MQKEHTHIYLYRTRNFRLSPNLFISYTDMSKVRLFQQSLSRGIRLCIYKWYREVSLSPPVPHRSHSTRAVTTSGAFTKHIPFIERCKVVTWSSSLTFIRYYALDGTPRSDAQFGRAVLTNYLKSRDTQRKIKEEMKVTFL